VCSGTQMDSGCERGGLLFFTFFLAGLEYKKKGMEQHTTVLCEDWL